MLDRVEKTSKRMSNRYYESPRHGTQYALDIDYYDDLAKEVGCHPWPDVVLKQNPKAMWAAWYGGFHSSQWHLVGPFRDDRAEEWIRECFEQWSRNPAPENYADGQFWLTRLRPNKRLICAPTAQFDWNDSNGETLNLLLTV
eukprot:TRINITY_DN678_c0_g1_i3.p1 TRINITY_DN678_c0_g1~~TRINITY_DN678_c0_g1_i3.p1  ORF type:complete len:142 (+),score=21.37 TRINITY_DN678_c0_g1_i3:333-758(+)